MAIEERYERCEHCGRDGALVRLWRCDVCSAEVRSSYAPPRGINIAPPAGWLHVRETMSTGETADACLEFCSWRCAATYAAQAGSPPAPDWPALSGQVAARDAEMLERLKAAGD